MTRKQQSLSPQGFSPITVLVVLFVVLAAGFGGWYVWHKNKSGTVAKTTTSQKSTAQNKQPSATVDPYAGWKTECDTVYSYCFKYPSDWTLGGPTVADETCGAGGAAVFRPDDNAAVNYTNANNKDGSLLAFTAVSIDKPIAANQDLTIVGGYIPYDTGYLSSYSVVDTSQLTSYPLMVGQTSSFPMTPRFTDLNVPDQQRCTGSFFAQSGQLDLASAKAWFTTADAKTSLQILKSFYYNRAR